MIITVLWLCRALRQTAVMTVSPSMDVVCGTVFLLNCVRWSRLTCPDINWRLFRSLNNCRVLTHCTVLHFITLFNSNNNNNNINFKTIKSHSASSTQPMTSETLTTVGTNGGRTRRASSSGQFTVCTTQCSNQWCSRPRPTPKHQPPRPRP